MDLSRLHQCPARCSLDGCCGQVENSHAWQTADVGASLYFEADCLKFAGGDSVAQSIMDALRELEASAGRAQRSRLTLTGQIEMDATVLRSFKVGPASQAYAAEIQAGGFCVSFFFSLSSGIHKPLQPSEHSCVCISCLSNTAGLCRAEGRGRARPESQKVLSFCTLTTPIPVEGPACAAGIAKSPKCLHIYHADP